MPCLDMFMWLRYDSLMSMMQNCATCHLVDEIVFDFILVVSVRATFSYERYILYCKVLAFCNFSTACRSHLFHWFSWLLKVVLELLRFSLDLFNEYECINFLSSREHTWLFGKFNLKSEWKLFLSWFILNSVFGH